MAKLRIAIFTDYHPAGNTGGTETSVMAQAQQLRDEGHTVLLVTAKPSHISAEPNTDIVELSSLPRIIKSEMPILFPSPRLVSRISKLLKDRGPFDVVHVHTNAGIGIAGAVGARRLGIPLVHTMHTREDALVPLIFPFPAVTTRFVVLAHRLWIPHPIKVDIHPLGAAARRIWRLSVNHAQYADVVVVPSQHYTNTLKKGGVTREIHTISNGLSDELYGSIHPIEPSHYHPGKTLSLAWCGRLSKEKRADVLLQALVELKDIRATLYGDGPERESLARFIAEYGLEERVTLRGRVPQEEILRELPQYDLLCHTSFGFDNQPMVLIEAQAAGLPVVVSDKDLAEAVAPGGAIVTETESADSLRKTLQHFQEHPEELQAMQKAMYAARSHSAQSHATSRILALYMQQISPKHQ